MQSPKKKVRDKSLSNSFLYNGRGLQIKPPPIKLGLLILVVFFELDTISKERNDDAFTCYATMPEAAWP